MHSARSMWVVAASLMLLAVLAPLPVASDDFEERLALYRQHVEEYRAWIRYQTELAAYPSAYDDACACICNRTDDAGRRIEFATCCVAEPSDVFGPGLCTNTREVCQDLTVCREDEYESQAPNATRDRRCSPLTGCRPFLDFQSQAPTFSSDRMCSPLRAPCAPNEYEANASPTGMYLEDRQCLPATPSCPPGSYIAHPATTTSNTECRSITVCSSTQYEAKPATASSDAQCANLTECDRITEFQTMAPSATTDRECKRARVCNSSEYQTVPLTIAADRNCSAVTECGPEEFETRAPTLSSDRRCKSRQICGADTYEAEAATASSDRVCFNVSRCSGAEYETRAPSASSDRDCKTATVCNFPAEFESEPLQAAADRVCTRATVCQPTEFQLTDVGASTDRICKTTTACNLTTQYVSQRPTPQSDRECAQATTCLPSQFETRPLSEFQDRLCAPLRTCTASEYQSKPHSLTTDRECTTLTPECDGQTAYESSPPTETSDRTCSPVTECQRGEYELSPPASLADRKCRPIKECQEGEYETLAPTGTSDRQCKLLTSCSATEYISTNHTATSDRVCTPATNCSRTLEYESTPATATSDRVCATLTICDPELSYELSPRTVTSDRTCANLTLPCNLETFFQSRAPTPTSDRVCSPLTVCDAESEFESVPKSRSSDRICQTLTICAAGSYVRTQPTATSDRECQDCGCAANADCVLRNATASPGAEPWCNAAPTLPEHEFFSHTCRCRAGYAGNGFSCGVDSDGDARPDVSLGDCFDSCLSCIGDLCPNDPTINSLARSDLAPTAEGAVSFFPMWGLPGGPTATETDPVWALHANPEVVGVKQLANSKPTILVAPQRFTSVRFEGILEVRDLVDDDFIGWAFGVQNSSQFYVMAWKATDLSEDNWDNPLLAGLPNLQGAPQSYGRDQNDRFYRARAGVQIKRVTGPVADFAMWSTNNLTALDDPVRFANVKTLWHDRNQTSWVPETRYRFVHIIDGTRGSSKARIYRISATGGADELIVDVPEMFLPNLDGGVGLYNLGQRKAYYTGLSFTCNLDGQSDPLRPTPADLDFTSTAAP